MSDHQNESWFRRLRIRAAMGNLNEGLHAVLGDLNNMKHVHELYARLKHLLTCLTGSEEFKRLRADCKEILSEYKAHAAQAAVLLHAGDFNSSIKEYASDLNSMAERDAREELYEKMKHLVNGVLAKLGPPQILELKLHECQFIEITLDIHRKEALPYEKEPTAASAKAAPAVTTPKRKTPVRREESDNEEEESNGHNGIHTKGHATQNGIKRPAGAAEPPSSAKKLKAAREEGAVAVKTSGSAVKQGLLATSPLAALAMQTGRQKSTPTGPSPGRSERSTPKRQPEKPADEDTSSSDDTDAQDDDINKQAKKAKTPEKGRQSAQKQKRDEESDEEEEDDEREKPKHSKGKEKGPITGRKNTAKSPGQEVPFTDDEDENGGGSSAVGKTNNAGTPQSGVRPRKQRRQSRRWSEEEIKDLRLGVQRHGLGKWAQIRDDESLKFDNRTNVDLKDAWSRLCEKGETEQAEEAEAPGN